MRVREWYGWHFPELSKVVPVDSKLFCRLIQKMRNRSNAVNLDFSDILQPEIEEELKEAAQISMGTEISEEDIDNIINLCVQVIDIYDYRDELFEYIKNRMRAIAPNLTLIVGELVGARLIAHAGSLINLAKHPASTVQILGAEKALFRALKTKSDTPKYGLIYHASLVGQTTPKNRGKICRVLAAKAALSVRVDALSDKDETKNAASHFREQVIARIETCDKGVIRQQSGKAKTLSQQPKAQQVKTYDQPEVFNTEADSTLGKNVTPKIEMKEKTKDKIKDESMDEASSEDEKKKDKKKKDNKAKKAKKAKKDKENEKKDQRQEERQEERRI